MIAPLKLLEKLGRSNTKESEGLKQKQETKEEYVEEEVNLEEMTKAQLIEFAKNTALKSTKRHKSGDY